MRLDRWHALADSAGPFASLSLDVSRRDPSSQHELQLRWQQHERDLAAQGAPPRVLQALGSTALAPTGRGGEVGRLVIIAGQDGDGDAPRTMLDMLLPNPPFREEAVWGPAPHLLPAVRALDAFTPYVLVKVDRAGADIEVHSLPDGPVQPVEVQGDHDVLHKVPGGGWSHLRYQHRAEDSWERNATKVATALDDVVRRHAPSVVLIAGDEWAASALLDHGSGSLRERAVRLPTGGRAEGISTDEMFQAVQAALAEHRRKERAEIIDRYSRAEGRQEAAVQGFGAVVDALRRAQVEELLLRDDPSSTLTLWVGRSPLHLATDPDELATMGAQHIGRTRADSAFVWALLAARAGITLLADEDDLKITDGIAAVLRWSDPSTPRDAIPSMPGHGESG